MVGSLALDANVCALLASPIGDCLLATCLKIVGPTNGSTLIVLLLVILELGWTHGLCFR